MLAHHGKCAGAPYASMGDWGSRRCASAQRSATSQRRYACVFASYEDPEGLQQKRLCLRKASRHREEGGWRGPRPLQPASQRLDGKVLALPVPESERVDDTPLSTVAPESETLVDLDGLAAHKERGFVEAMPADRRADSRGTP